MRMSAVRFRPRETIYTGDTVSLSTKISDLFARSMTAFFRLFADLFFRKRYGHRALVLETVAGVLEAWSRA